MANRILLKRDNTVSKVPLITDLEFGELGYNYNDGRLYGKRETATSPFEEIVLIGDPTGKVVDHVGGLIPAQTGTTVIPFDDTVPLATEGTEIGAGIVTFEHTTDFADIHFSLSLESSSANKTIILAIFRDTTCIGAIPISMPNNNTPSPLSWGIVDHPSITGAATYSGRVGITGGAWKVNSPALGTLGGAIAAASTFSIDVVTRDA